MLVTRKHRRPAFTLVELLVVIAIIGVLVALLLPAVQAAREAARRSSCQNNLKQLAIAVHNFHDTQNRLPYNGDPNTLSGCCYDANARQWSWIARSLPYMEQNNLYDQARIGENELMANRLDYIKVTVKLFLCPSDPDSRDPRTDCANFPGGTPVGQTNYKGVAGANWAWGNWTNTGPSGDNNGLDNGDGMFFRSDVKKTRTLASIKDGTSNTLMIGEDIPAMNIHCAWPYSNTATGTCSIPPNTGVPKGTPPGIDTTPGNWPNVYSFRSHHPAGLQFALADGSVTFIPKSIDLTVYRNAATRNGGESTSLP